MSRVVIIGAVWSAVRCAVGGLRPNHEWRPSVRSCPFGRAAGPGGPEIGDFYGFGASEMGRNVVLEQHFRKVKSAFENSMN